MVTYRDLTTRDELAAVVDLERAIWGPGYDDVVPVPILTITIMRGAILIGAFDAPERETSAERLVGFVYSIPGLKDGRPMQWSHMLGVVDEFRSDGIGYKLKLLQRDRTLAMNLDLIEWTFDPMQALNAHLNFTKLGVVVQEYEENVYGESQSPLHRGNPTDRFVAEWHIREPRIEQAIGDAPRINRARPVGDLHECGDVDLTIDAPSAVVEIPMGFTEMLSRAPDLALAWRMATRLIFATYFSRGYRAVGFTLDRAGRKGSYALARQA
jgi:predicted GNAT superfamily acetyltransferase